MNGNKSFGLMLLPDVLMEKVVRKLHRPKDVVRFLAVNKRTFNLTQRTTPLNLDLTEYKNCDPMLMARVITSISTFLTGVKKIKASDTSINSPSLSQLWSKNQDPNTLIQLDELDCSNCKKIELQSAIWDPTNIKHVNLQRCFRLTSAAFVKLLSNTSQNVRLEFLAVSHLELINLQNQLNLIIKNNQEAAQKLAQAPSVFRSSGLVLAANRNLKVLALNNSSEIDVQSLHAVRICCPMLQYLFLGGSIQCATQTDPEALEFVRNQEYLNARKLVKQQIQDASKTLPIELATLLCIWRGLKLIEMTFCTSPEVLGTVSSLHQQVAGFELQILNLVEENDMHRAIHLVQQSQQQKEHALLMGIQCAFCCSSPAKQTLLHLAVMAGKFQQVKMLLSVSQNQLLDVKGRYGGTALFRACEMGYVEIVQLLISSGADPWLRNSGGEVPLYIAALKGKINVVTCLLDHFEKVGDQTWQDIQRYGDDWTPLMAAAVGNRLDIVQILLEACRDIETFCALKNRYGQTALHIAALRGRFEIVRELISWRECLHLLNVKDSMGKTPIEVAQAHSWGEVVTFLKQYRSALQTQVPG
eukprot:TRINITY_DN17620_c0_g1_i1.p1 TRINITY_DN17620_c0_g1~~TRINITY_DN17620_c0_g1_i1.p1  ORF type:complete len:646 (-),score=66.39 TRINITY_DN17620_c0_g1_i1:186-1943(-)